MEVKKFLDDELYIKGAEIEHIGNMAIKELQKENKKNGIPLVYSINGNIYYELPNGQITNKSPFNSTD